MSKFLMCMIIIHSGQLVGCIGACAPDKNICGVQTYIFDLQKYKLLYIQIEKQPFNQNNNN